jgi:hypothetical protein
MSKKRPKASKQQAIATLEEIIISQETKPTTVPRCANYFGFHEKFCEDFTSTNEGEECVNPNCKVRKNKPKSL